MTDGTLRQHETNYLGEQVIVHYRWRGGKVQFKYAENQLGNEVDLDSNYHERIKSEIRDCERVLV